MKLQITSIVLFSFLITSSLLFAQDFSSLEYRTVGPERGGRVTTVTGVPSLPNTFYLGATGGGVWKTEDYGTTWNNISDGFFETPSIGAIEVSVKNPTIIYVGTGSDGLRSNVIAGKGVYKSIDSGKTWKHIGLNNVGQIGAVEIHPKDDNIVWVAVIGNAFTANEERGIYKTIDGGLSWEKVLYISDTVGFSDLEFVPTKPNIVYAAAWKAQRTPWTIDSGGENKDGGIYKSKNGGKDWEKLENGLPQGLIGKIDLAVSPTDKNLLYAVIEAPGKESGLYKSENQGKSFAHISNNKGLTNRPFYYTNIEIDPTNPAIVYSNANPLLKSVDGGENWEKMSVPHGDNHDIWLNPNNPELLIQCNDGGANVSHNGGKTWSTQFNQPTAELYQVEVDDQYPYWLYAGQQDNSTTIAVPSFPPSGVQNSSTGWLINTGGCETGPAVPKPGNHNVVYANCKGRFGVFDKRTGTEKSYYVGASNIYGHNPKDLKYRFQRVAPIHVSPHNPNVVYHGSQYVHKTVNDGLTWETISPDLTAFEADKQQISGNPITRDITGEEYYSTLYSIRESPVLQGTIWTGSNDGVISVTQDGGANWKNVTPLKLPKGGRVESIEPSQFDAAKAYIAVDRHLLGDTKPYLYVTKDFGNSWQLLTDGTNGIPSNFTARVLREDPLRSGLLYVGTEFGVFISMNDGVTWQKFQQNVPITPITDIKIFRGDLILSTMGRGFWILDNITSLRQDEISNLNTEVVLFKPDTTVRYRYPNARGVDYKKYPKTSVIIDYFIPKDYKGSIKLEILDKSEKVVSTILSDSTAIKAEIKTIEVTDMNLSSVFRYTDKKLLATAGMHRFNWDLLEKGAWDSIPKKQYKNGPTVLPGAYTARLTAGGKTVEKSFEIIMDPRNKVLGVRQSHLIAQKEMQHNLIDLLSKAKRLQANLKQQLTTLKGDENQAKKKGIEDSLALLENAEGAYPQQMYIAQVQYLLYMISGADQLPGDEAVARYAALMEQFEGLK